MYPKPYTMKLPVTIAALLVMKIPKHQITCSDRLYRVLISRKMHE